jgi:SAM-dependent methyltransferase
VHGDADDVAYWDDAAATKRFTHALYRPWLRGVPEDARLLDYGCGQGRVVADLRGLGYRDVCGVDLSPAMIDKARAAVPEGRFAVLDHPPHCDLATASVDLVLLFAVLTCIPDDADQGGVVAEIARVLRPGGLLYLSGLPLQDDERHVQRYERFASSGGRYGVFSGEDGAVFRHHDRRWLSTLLRQFEIVDEREFAGRTMNGHPAKGLQLLARRLEKVTSWQPAQTRTGGSSSRPGAITSTS